MSLKLVLFVLVGITSMITSPVPELVEAGEGPREDSAPGAVITQLNWVNERTNMCMIQGEPLSMELCVARFGEEEVGSWARVYSHAYSSIIGSNIA